MVSSCALKTLYDKLMLHKYVCFTLRAYKINRLAFGLITLQNFKTKLYHLQAWLLGIVLQTLIKVLLV